MTNDVLMKRLVARLEIVTPLVDDGLSAFVIGVANCTPCDGIGKAIGAFVPDRITRCVFIEIDFSNRDHKLLLGAYRINRFPAVIWKLGRRVLSVVYFELDADISELRNSIQELVDKYSGLQVVAAAT